MTRRQFDPAACLVVPAVALALSGVSLLSFRLPSRADTPAHAAALTSAPRPAVAALTTAPTPAAAVSAASRPAAAPAPAPTPVTTKADIAASSDGDGDELLEHWGDPKYGREERMQLAGMGAFLLGAAAMHWKRALRTRRLIHAANA